MTAMEGIASIGSRRSTDIRPAHDVEKGNNDTASDNSRKSSLDSGEFLEQGDIEGYPEGEKPEPVTKTNSNIAKKILSRVSTKKSWIDPGPPPDGGFQAWLQCAMGCTIVVTTWGFINCFGMFQAYYVSALGHPPSDIAWIGSLQVFLLFFVGTFTGRLSDAGYFKQITTFGAVLQLLGYFMTSISYKYWHVLLAQGVAVGIGNGCLFTPGISTLSTYFSTRKSLAIGIAASGSSVGGLIFTAMVRQLLPKIGFAWTMRALGLVDLVLLAAVILFSRQRVPPRRTGPIVDWESFRDMTYLFYGIGMFFVFWGVYFAFFYISAYSRDVIGYDQTAAISVIMVLNGVGIVGRIIPNHMADVYFGPMNLLIVACVSSAMLAYVMIVVKTGAGIYVWAVFYGMTGAAIQSLFPATLGSLSAHDLSKVGVRMGMIFVSPLYTLTLG
jgi:predicted MFS family arabinose efflux permease